MTGLNIPGLVVLNGLITCSICGLMRRTRPSRMFVKHRSLPSAVRPIFGPAGIPADRVKILREAFAKALSDPELLAEAKKKRLEIEPVSGEEIEALAKEVIVQPPEVVERIKKLLGK